MEVVLKLDIKSYVQNVKGGSRGQGQEQIDKTDL